tara:strand:- start:2258 stop:4867 length:2610 start_codon:yes stop_codon:yes gene_type:complete
MSDSQNIKTTKKEKWLKKLAWHFFAITIFVCISAFYCSPAFDGKKIYAHDTNQHKGISKEAVDHREAYNEEPLWTNSIFGGLPTFQISIRYPKNLIQYVDKGLNLGLPHPAGIVFKYMLGFYILLLVFGVPWKYAIPGAIAFAFSSYFMIVLEAGHNSKANSISYVAPMIAGIILSFRGRYLYGGAITSFFLSLNIVANHVQITYYAGLCVALLGIVELIKALQQKTLKQFGIASLVSLGALILSLLVNNTNLRLTNDYVKDTQRGKSRLEIKSRQAKEKQKLQEAKFQEIENGNENQSKYLSPKKAYATRWSYGIQESLTILVPYFNGGGSSDSHTKTKTYKTLLKSNMQRYRGVSRRELKEYTGKQTGQIMYWGEQPGVNGPVYIGAGICLLFVLGLIFVKSKYKWWLLATAILGLFISYGKNMLPFFNFMYDYFPLYDKFRAVTIGMVITEFAVPLLGFIFLKELLLGELDKVKVAKFTLYVTLGFWIVLGVFYLGGESLFAFMKESDEQMGPDILEIIKEDRIALFRSDIKRSLIYTFFTGIIVYALTRKKVNHNLLAAGLGVVCLLDLYGVSSRYLNENVYEKKLKVLVPFEKTRASKEILKDNSNYRVFNASNGFSSAINDASTAYYHHTIGGYSSVKLMIYQDMLDFSLGSEMQYIASWVDRYKNQLDKIPPNIFTQVCSNTNIVNMLNTKYVIADENKPPLVNHSAFGNAWLVSGIKTYDSPDSVMFNLRSQNIRQIALAEKKDVEEISGKSYSTNGKISLTDYKANHLSYSFTSSDDAFVVFSEVFYKSWNAYIDGELIPHNRVNYVLRGLEVPKGQHSIEFKFEPEVYFQGENISLFASFIVLGLFLFAGYKGGKELTV